MRQLLDGSWRVYVKDALVATAVASSLEELKPIKRHKRSAADKAFRRSVRQLEGRPELAAQQSPRRAAKRAATSPPFNSFGQLTRRKKHAA